MKKYKILLVEDEENFGAVLKHYLELNDYDVVWCADGVQGLSCFNTVVFDLCILDVMMPQKDGFTLAKEIKTINPNVPLLFLTAKKMKEDVVNGYKLGAEDYITKPFDTEILLYKLQIILNRHKESVFVEEGKSIYSFGVFTFNTQTRELNSANNNKKLSPKEAELLKLLCANLNKVVSRDVALKKIWNDNNYFTTRSMDVFIVKLRKYLKEDSSLEIINVHGNGFRLLVK